MTRVKAKVVLDDGAGRRELEFGKIAVDHKDKKHLVISLAEEGSHTLHITVSKAELRKLISWKMIMSL